MSEHEVPEDLSYTSDHEWVRDMGEGIRRVGITAYAQDALGDIVFVSLPNVNDKITAGENCGEVESHKSVSDLYAPVNGTVTAVNDALDGSPELINSDPYTEGWMFDLRVDADNPGPQLLDAKNYADLLD